MMTQNVLTQAANNFSGVRTGEVSKGKSADGTGFGQIMNQVKGSGQRNEPGIRASKTEIAVQKNEAANRREKTKGIQEQTARKAANEKKVDMTPETEEKMTDEDQAERAITELNASIVQAVMQILQVQQISQEQFEQAMENLGLNPEDLLDSANVTKLIMELNQLENPMELLTDEGLSGQVTDINQSLSQLDFNEHLGTTKEEVLRFLEERQKEQPEELVKEQRSELNFDKKISAAADETGNSPKSRHKENGDEGENFSRDKNITVTVEKETEHAAGQKEFAGGSEQERKGRDSRSNETRLENFIENLSLKGQNISEVSVQGMERIETMREIVHQVVEQIKVIIKSDSTSMEMQLNPENLGKINLVVASKNGQLTASFTTQNQIAKEALENQIQVLRDSLSSQGLKVEAVEVTVSNFEFNFNQNNQMSGGQNQSKNHGRRKIDLSEFDDKGSNVSEEEILAAKVLKESGGSVEYIA